jgi:hypothetical protein
MTSLSCDGCTSLRELPELSHTYISLLSCTGCSLLTEIPDLPPYLDYLHASNLPCVRRLLALSSRGYNAIYIDNIGITELPDPLPAIDDLNCSNTRIQQLPVIAGCGALALQSCKRLQQLPERLPAGLGFLNCSGCTALQQLPAQLPDRLRMLYLDNCTRLCHNQSINQSSIHFAGVATLEASARRTAKFTYSNIQTTL